MASHNRVILIGNLTRDPELRFLPKGTAVCRMGLAMNRTWTTDNDEKREEVTFVDVDMFGRLAENCAKYLKKGSSAMVEGRLKLDTWDDKKTGEKRSKLGVMAEAVQFLDGKREGNSSAPSPAPAAPKSYAEIKPETEDSDVPF